MGISCSCYNRSRAAAAVKLILIDGTLQEFSCPIKVSLVLPSNSIHDTTFICSADDVDFDVYVSAMKMGEDLRQGQLYFELPSSWLTRRIGAEDMAALTIKATEALTQSISAAGVGKFGCCMKRVDPYFEFCSDEESSENLWRGGTSGRAGGERKLKKSLSVIMEE